MRRLLPLVLILLTLGTSLYAATYTTRNFTAAQEARLTRARLTRNAATCVSVGLPTNCTEAQAQAINSSLRVPPDTSSYLDVVLVGALLEIQAQQSADDSVQACNNFKAANQAGKDTMCVALGLTAGCELCR